MRKYIRAVLAATMFVAAAAQASTRTTEITDMWWNPSESGWGINVILQNNLAFMTFFIYDANRNPVWYTAQLTLVPGSTVWSGGVYATRGPWFGGGIFDPTTVVLRTAGTAVFNLTDVNQATFTYIIDGTSVTKMVQRQTWTNEDYSGIVAGGYSIRLSSCTPASLNGLQEQLGAMNVIQNGPSVTINATFTGLSCTFAGAYSQMGKLGQIIGTYTCTDGTHGNFTTSEMTPTTTGFIARISGQNQSCQWSGNFGGIRRAP